MIGKIMQNHSFRATSRYVIEKEKAEIIGGNLFGETLDAIVDELAMTKALNPEIARPVYHLTQSYTAADKETGKLTHTRLAQLAIRHFAGMAISASEPALLEDTAAFHKRVRQFLQAEIHTHSFFVAVHHDREHLHTHLVASRINLRDGKCIPTWYEQVRSKKVCRLLEQQFGLEPVATTRASLDQATRDRLVQTAGVLARLAPAGASLEDTPYTLTRQGATLTLRRKHDDSIALKAYRDKQERWQARGGDLTPQECVWWQAKSQLETQPAAVAPVLEASQAPNLLELIKREQAKYMKRLVPQIEAIWERQKAARPKLTRTNFEHYGLCLSAEGKLELYRCDQQGRERRLLGFTKDAYQAEGVTEQDCAAIDRFDAFTRKEAEARLERFEAEQRQQQREQAIKAARAAREIEVVAPNLADFLKQKNISFYKGNRYTFGLTGEQQERLLCHQNADQTLVFEAELRQGKWTAITGQVPPEVKQACVQMKKDKPEPAKVPTKKQSTR